MHGMRSGWNRDGQVTRELARLSQLLMVWLGLLLAPQLPAADYDFELRWDPRLRQEPYGGRVYLFFGSDPQKEPRLGPSWFHPEPFASVDIPQWSAGQPLLIGKVSGKALHAFPTFYSELQLAGYQVQAAARFNPWDRRVGTGSGNAYSLPVTLPPRSDGKPIPLLLNQIVAEKPFPQNAWCRLLKIRSRLLTEFHHREMELQACVVLPASYAANPNRRYPVILEVPGFGGTHLLGVKAEPVQEQNPGNVEFIRVTLDPSCPLGHHVFADSANNGPVGLALIQEFLPALDQQFRTVAAPTARFLTGHSSGGWSSLWLQVTYPDIFGGTWSTAPDPVDFHDFQQIDLYHAGSNMFRDSAGNRRPLARDHGRVAIWYDDFDRMETILGYGGQLRSFEAVFSPRDRFGQPAVCWDRLSGNVYTTTAAAWRKYDIRLTLESRWKELGPKLRGKLHVFMGDADTFFLDGAARRLQATMQKLGSDAVIELHPGRTHFDIITPELQNRIHHEMAESFLKHHRVN